MPVPKGPAGVRLEMDKFKQGKLHSGSKKGPVVTNPKQAIAIALHEAGMARGVQKPLKPRNMLSQRNRAMRDRSTKGSPPMSVPEIMCGYRRVS